VVYPLWAALSLLKAADYVNYAKRKNNVVDFLH
jgi:hypothetical protein